MTVALRNVGPDDCRFLYDLLRERQEEANISHRQMPTFEEHCAFVAGGPYKKWYIILLQGNPVGAIYLTDRNEIGIGMKRTIYLTDRNEKKLEFNVMMEAVMALMAEEPGVEYFANISPRNQALIGLFKQMGFRHIQNTYRIKG